MLTTVLELEDQLLQVFQHPWPRVHGLGSSVRGEVVEVPGMNGLGGHGLCHVQEQVQEGPDILPGVTTKLLGGPGDLQEDVKK